MSDSCFAWKHRKTGEITLPLSKRPKTVEDLFAGCGYGLPVRELEAHLPVRIILVNNVWIEEKDFIWETIVKASTT